MAAISLFGDTNMAAVTSCEIHSIVVNVSADLSSRVTTLPRPINESQTMCTAAILEDRNKIMIFLWGINVIFMQISLIVWSSNMAAVHILY